jgi:hypothetical protein
LVGETLDVAVVDWIRRGVLCLSQIWSGLLPIEYRIERKPDWYVFLNICET